MRLHPFRMRVPFIPQMEISECGAAALSMVLAHFGCWIPLADVRTACGVSRGGASAAAVVDAARQFGLQAEGVAVEADRLKSLPLPAILHWGFRHFVVLEKVRRRSVTVLDPALGRRRISHRELDRLFTGVALVFSPGESFRSRPRQDRGAGRFLALLRSGLSDHFFLFAASLILQILALAFPVALQMVVDSALPLRQSSMIVVAGLVLTATALLSATLSATRAWVAQAVIMKIDLLLSTTFLHHLMRLPLAFFFQRSPGDLIQRMQSNSAIRDLLITRLVKSTLDTVALVGSVFLLYAYSPPVAAVILLFALGRNAVAMVLRSRLQQTMAGELAASGRETASLVETLSKLETIKASGTERDMAQRWTDRRVQRLNMNAERRRLEIAGEQLGILLRALGLAAVVWLAGREVMLSRISPGVFVALLALEGTVALPLQSLGDTLYQFQLIGAHLGRMDDVLSARIEPSGDAVPSTVTGSIELREVTFRYAPNDVPVVQDVSCSIAACSKIALVGPSGAGKSTIAQLIMGLQSPESGSVFFDGVDLRLLNLKALRGRLGVVLQDSQFITDTVSANINLHDPSITVDEIRQAAAIACIDDVIEALPDSYETRLFQSAGTLSGGQRQRLAIARAIVRSPAVLLLDEATSALDPVTEANVHSNLGKLGMTRIVITHRLATIEDADRIFVIDHGRIVDQGSFDDLSGRRGIFQDLNRAGARHA